MSLLVDIEKNLGQFSLRVRFEAGNTTTALLGASGCGKSVTLKCIAGIMTPDRGRIVLGGRTLFDRDKHINLTPQERRVGYLFQQYALFPNMTVEQNIQCGIRAGSRAEKRRLCAQAVKRFRLEGLERKYPVQLSGGQQQRTALARILLSEPECILLDEPFSALDSFLKWNLELELSDILSGFDGPILWVSHDRGECRRNCENVCVMEEGLVKNVTTMALLSESPASAAEAQLMGYKNILRAERTERGVRFPDWGLEIPAEIPGGFENAVIPDAAVSAGGKLPFHAVRTITDLGGDILLIRPEGAPPDSPVMSIRRPQGEGSGAVFIDLLPEKMLFI